MYINNIPVNGRHNRPSVLSRTALVTYFLNDGQYADPHSISAVSIFAASNNFPPSSIVGVTGEINQDFSAAVLMNFSNSATSCADSAFDVSNFSIGASGIYKLRTGVYAVVLDSDIAEFIFNLSGENLMTNTLSATGDYLDIWTIKRTAGSDLDTLIHKFTLNDDRFMAVTEPVLFRVATRLENNHLVLGSEVDLKFTNEFTIENTNIDRSIVNLFKDSFVLDPAIEIYKENVDRNLPSRVSVSSFSDTSALCDVTSDNTVIFTFDTSVLSTHPQAVAGNLGAATGTYVARLRFTALNQTVYSNLFAFIIR
jgi:hypothetical protein